MPDGQETRAERNKRIADANPYLRTHDRPGEEVGRLDAGGLRAETRVVDPNTGGAKGSKLEQLGLVDPLSLLEVGAVAGFGAQKYDAWNYLKGYAWSLSMNAGMRHRLQFWSGEDRDPESGLYHLAHAAWNDLALLSFVMRDLGTDDRPPK